MQEGDPKPHYPKNGIKFVFVHQVCSIHKRDTNSPIPDLHLKMQEGVDPKPHYPKKNLFCVCIEFGTPFVMHRKLCIPGPRTYPKRGIGTWACCQHGGLHSDRIKSSYSFAILIPGPLYPREGNSKAHLRISGTLSAPSSIAGIHQSVSGVAITVVCSISNPQRDMCDDIRIQEFSRANNTPVHKFYDSYGENYARAAQTKITPHQLPVLLDSIGNEFCGAQAAKELAFMYDAKTIVFGTLE
ncbi:hypothetical protein CEXT_513711 [Caerostris extrusa]|uniref:Uncharacterized protein n=1 Tax=Caerostris extrusa TaxID=172846 RepID=A0AAV4RTS7_CAEEX|nr:hypothetical protein CEXT_513711 [Caerostris extrusa]